MNEEIRPEDAGVLMSLALEHLDLADENHDPAEFRRAAEHGKEAYSLFQERGDDNNFERAISAAAIVAKSLFMGGDIEGARDFGKEVLRDHGDRVKGPLRYEIAETVEYAELRLSRNT